MPTPHTRLSGKPICVGVIGCGRMGRHHVRIYSQMPLVKLVGVYDASPTTAAAVADEFSVPAFQSIEELLAQVEAVTIAVPTQYHLPVAEQCLNRKIACLIEKPLARDVTECRKIADLAIKNDVAVQVGHIERFNPAFRALQRLELKPRFMEVSRISPMTFRSLDVGVVLDMMIHDIDLILRLADSKVTKIEAVGVSVLGDVEDICNARITFASGCVANVTANRLAMRTDRRLRFYSSDAFVSVDYQKRTGTLVRRGGNLESLRAVATKIRAGETPDPSQLNYLNLLKTEDLQVDNLDPLQSQLSAFIDAVASGSKPVVDAEAGLNAVDVASQIVRAMGRDIQL